MKIYPYLRLFWLCQLIGTLLNLTSASDSNAVLLFGSFASLAVYGVTVYTLHALAKESARLSRAFTCQMFAVVLLALSVVCSLIASSEMLLIFVTLLMLMGSIFMLISEYHFYWGLDERIIPNAYAFPARRIRWCFYMPLVGAFIAVSLQLMGITIAAAAVQIVCQIIPLALLFQYNRAVRDREENPL